jgi:hypothetical protein
MRLRFRLAAMALWRGHLEADLKLKEQASQKLVPAGQAASRFQADEPLLDFPKPL